MRAPSIDELIARSSFGRPSVTKARTRTSPAVAEEVVRRTDRTKLFGKSFLIRVLRELDRRQQPDVMTVVDILYGDPFDFGSLGPRTDCGIPGILNGQLADWRISTDGDDGLHGHVRHDGVAFHLDRRDACRSPLAHGALDTQLLSGALVGGFALAAIVALAGGKSEQVTVAAAVGAGVGGAIGASVPARRSSAIRYRDLLAAASLSR